MSRSLTGSLEEGGGNGGKESMSRSKMSISCGLLRRLRSMSEIDELSGEELVFVLEIGVLVVDVSTVLAEDGLTVSTADESEDWSSC